MEAACQASESLHGLSAGASGRARGGSNGTVRWGGSQHPGANVSGTTKARTEKAARQYRGFSAITLGYPNLKTVSIRVVCSVTSLFLQIPQFSQFTMSRATFRLFRPSNNNHNWPVLIGCNPWVVRDLAIILSILLAAWVNSSINVDSPCLPSSAGSPLRTIGWCGLARDSHQE